MDLFEYQGKQYFARYGIPVSPGGVADTVDEAVAAADARRLPGRREGPGAGRRPRQGRRHQARQRRRRGPRRTPANILGMDIKGHVVEARVGRARLATSPRSTTPSFTLDRARQEAPRHAVGARAASRSRRSPTTNPDAIAKICTSTRSTGSTEADAPRAGSTRRSSNPAAIDGAVDILLKLYRCLRRGRRDLVEINPLILTPDGEVHALDAKVTLDDNAAFRHPEWDEYRRHRGARRARAAGPREGPAVHRPRRLRSASSPTAPGWR